MLLVELFHKSLEAVWEFGCKKVLVLASQGLTEEEGYLRLGEVEAIGDLLCPRVMVALLHGIVLTDEPCIALVHISWWQLTLSG